MIKRTKQMTDMIANLDGKRQGLTQKETALVIRLAQ